MCVVQYELHYEHTQLKDGVYSFFLEQIRYSYNLRGMKFHPLRYHMLC